MRTRLQLINAALTGKLGEQPLEFESEEAAAAFGANATINPEDDVQRTMASIYPSVRSTGLNAHPWSWLTERHRPAEAPHRANEAVARRDWKMQYRYHLANPFVSSIRAVYLQGQPDVPSTDPYQWAVLGGYLFSRMPVIAIEDQRQIDETAWPELFDTYIISMLASKGAIPIMQDLETARLYAAEAAEDLRNAIRVDSQSHPVRHVPRFPSLEARLGGSRELPSGWVDRDNAAD